MGCDDPFDTYSAARKAEQEEQAEYMRRVQYRTVVERVENALDSVRQLPASRRVSLAITKLEEAIMWLDKDGE